MTYPTAEDILALHDRLIEETGGAHGVRDVDLLIAASERSKMQFSGKPLYPTIFEKAAVCLDSLIRNHVFVDGNKRTAVLAAAWFLSLNGHALTATNQALEKFVLMVAVQKPPLQKIADWLKQHSRRLSRS